MSVLSAATLTFTSACRTPAPATELGDALTAKPTDPATLPDAACHVRLPTHRGGPLPIEHAPRLIITPERAQLDHLPIRLDELELALQARALRLDAASTTRAARFLVYVEYVESLASSWGKLELRLIDDARTNAFFDGLRGALPSGFEVRSEDGMLSIEHADLDALRAFMKEHVDPEHIIGYERALRAHVAGQADVWSAHYILPEVAFVGRSGDAPSVESDLTAEAVTLSFSVKERARVDALTDLTSHNVGKRIALMSGDEVLLKAMVWEYIDGGDVLLTLEPALKNAMMSTPEGKPMRVVAPHTVRVAFDERLSLTQVRAHLARARAALPKGLPAVAFKPTPFRPVISDDPELNALIAKAFDNEKDTKPPAEPGPDTCPEMMEFGGMLEPLFFAERRAYISPSVQEDIEQACGCPDAELLIPFVTNTTQAFVGQVTLVTLAERLPEGPYVQRDVPPETSWGEAVAALEPGDCLNLGAPESPLLMCTTP